MALLMVKLPVPVFTKEPPPVKDELIERLRAAATSKVEDPFEETACKTLFPPRVAEDRDTGADELEFT